MKKSLFLLPVVAMLVAAGCSSSSSSNDKKNEFAQKVAEYVKNNRVDSLVKIYPEAKFDSLAFAKPYETIEFETVDSNKNVRAKFGDAAVIEIAEGENGELTIVSSKGIAAFPADKMETARQTGMLKNAETDVEIAKLLGNDDFFNWLNKKSADSSKNIISLKASKSQIGRCYGEGNFAVSMNVTLTNNSSIDLKASDYSIKYTKVYCGEESNNWKTTYGSGKQSGVDLKAGETKTVKLSTKHLCDISKPTIVMNISPDKLAALATFTGNEYATYLTEE